MGSGSRGRSGPAAPEAVGVGPSTGAASATGLSSGDSRVPENVRRSDPVARSDARVSGRGLGKVGQRSFLPSLQLLPVCEQSRMKSAARTTCPASSGRRLRLGKRQRPAVHPTPWVSSASGLQHPAGSNSNLLWCCSTHRAHPAPLRPQRGGCSLLGEPHLHEVRFQRLPKYPDSGEASSRQPKPTAPGFLRHSCHVLPQTREHLSKAQRGLVGDGVSEVMTKLKVTSSDGTSYSGDLLAILDVLKNMTEIFRRAYYSPSSADMRVKHSTISRITDPASGAPDSTPGALTPPL